MSLMQDHKGNLIPENSHPLPTVAAVLDVFGWFAIGTALLIAIFAFLNAQDATTTQPSPWPQITALCFGGLLFMAFSAIIRALHRIEEAIRKSE